MRRVDLGIGVVAGIVAGGIGAGAVVALTADDREPGKKNGTSVAASRTPQPGPSATGLDQSALPQQTEKSARPKPPAMPVTTADTSSVSLKWGASGGNHITGYRVYDGTRLLATAKGDKLRIKGLKACRTYRLEVVAFNPQGESERRTVQVKTRGCTPSTSGNPMATAYLHLGWGRPPEVKTVMDATGIRSFTMAFVLSDGGCNPAWDGDRPLQGGVDARTISQIKAAGGSVQISFGGWSGRKLGPACSSPEDYAAAVQKVIDAHGPAAVDFDVENTDELQNAAVQDRILRGLKIVKGRNPGVRVIVTMSTAKNGPDQWGLRLIRQAKALGVDIDNYTIMPFNFNGTDLRADTIAAAEGLKNALTSTWGWSDRTAYSRMGISGMNGHSDQKEVTTPATWKAIRDWSSDRGLGRLAFWSVNRDRPCPGDVVSTCSGVDQDPWQFTRITAGF
ncbi:fibronectin type III domain-containing protein [Actinocorallia populi]|uniref:fibronectin type III domain-containing protein n=1 Tax=Actinocorallia populi TaxID=2079200 RepID=UPI000D087CEB|nr:chitinase [Actinocorallia populi]